MIIFDSVRMEFYLVQVMAEATMNCATSLIESCQSHKYFDCLCAFITESKSAKLRQNCATLLLKVTTYSKISSLF